MNPSELPFDTALQAARNLCLEYLHDAVIINDAEDRIVYINRAAAALLDGPSHKFLGKPRSSILQISEQAMRRRDLLHAEDAYYGAKTKSAVVLLHKKRVPVDLLKLDNNELLAPGWCAYLIHDRRIEMSREQSMAEQARLDKLTGLLNRHELDRCLNNLVDDAETGERKHAFLYIDLDQFKVVNDTCGHQAGDELLRNLSMHLKSALQHSDIVGRLGGDEFGVLLCNVSSKDAIEVAERLCGVIRGIRFAWGSYSFAVGASIGVTMIDEYTGSAAVAMRQVDTACYAAKEEGRNRVHLYAENDRQLAQRQGEMQWLSRINQALDENRLCMVQQKIAPYSPEKQSIWPKCCYASKATTAL